MTRTFVKTLLAAGFFAAVASPAGAEPSKPECLAGAKPGGGFDLTCRLAANALLEAKIIGKPMAVTYMEGGVGAVAYNHVIGKRGADSNLITAASSGSALLIAQGKFGQYDETAVRWLGALGADYGVLVVAADSPLQEPRRADRRLQGKPDRLLGRRRRRCRLAGLDEGLALGKGCGTGAEADALRRA